MNPLQKRSNPFATKIESEQPKKEVKEVVEEEIEEDYEPKVVSQTRKPARKQVVEQQFDNNRDKYTSTMDRNVRRAIKILCAQRGILFASFVEDACREKLRKEGVL